MYHSLSKFYRSSAKQQEQYEQHRQEQQHVQQYQQQYIAKSFNHQHNTYNMNNSSNISQQFNINRSNIAHCGPVLPIISSRDGKYMQQTPSQSQSQSQLQSPIIGFANSGVRRHNSNATESCRNYWMHNHRNPSSAASQIVYRSERHHSKRKSAVELLAETKQYFVKSNNTTAQHSNYGTNNSMLLISNKRGRHNSSPIILTNGKHNSSYAETHYRPHIEINEHSSPSTTIQQQHQHRFSHIHHFHRHDHHNSIRCRTLSTRPTNYSTIGTSMPYQTGSNISSSDYTREKLNKLRSDSYAGNTITLNEMKAVSFEEDMAVKLPPPLYFSPQSFTNNRFENGEDPLVLTENYRPISPPAEYAEDPIQSSNQSNVIGIRHKYQRSHSHSHEMASDKAKRSPAAYNINSHKSLPDLSTQINRHSPHSEVLSCCSRGNRSIKSTGESSLNRDSGGSSGHYTHRSEPCYRQYREIVVGSTNGIKKCCSSVNATCRVEYRRDSGSSTQHSNTSYCEYVYKNDVENYDSSDYLFNFTTPEVPEAFQDDYVPPTPLNTPKYANEDAVCFRYSQPSRKICSSSCGDGGNGQQTSHTSYMKLQCVSGEPIVQSPGSTISIGDISPPPIQFRRQKCIRFKNHNRISLPQPKVIPANNSNGSSRLSQRRSEPPYYYFSKCFLGDDFTMQENKDSRQSTVTICKPVISSQECRSSTEPPSPASAAINLEKFFDRLGLQDDKYREIYAFRQRRHSECCSGEGDDERINNNSDSSTVFFSDVSTVDSMRLPDSTETQPQVTQSYRPTDQPSIVERNARIIKWLCNIRKAQGEML